MADTTNPSTSHATPNTDKVVTPDDKQVLIDDLKKTMHDMGRIPAILMAPVIAYVSSQYEKIPESRRATLQTIVTTLKTKGVHGLAALRTRFAEVSATNAAPAPTTPATAPAPAPTVTTPTVQTPAKNAPATEKPVAKVALHNKKIETKKTYSLEKTKDEHPKKKKKKK
jgi:type IV secretory pathway VirJ component